METEIDPVLDRIQQRLIATGKSERGAAEEAGLSAAAIRNLREGKSQSPRLDTIRKLAPVLESTPEWLAFGVEGLGSFGEKGLTTKPAFDPEVAESELKPSAAEVVESSRTLVPAGYAGKVAAGLWRDVEDFEDEPERPLIFVERDAQFPHAPVKVFDVEGDSMNALKPRPIMAGDRVIALEYEALGGNVPLRDGMVVVVEQALDGGHHRERSLKQVEIYEDRYEFCPRSTNPKFKPIVVPRTVFVDQSQEDGRQVQVIAWVRRIQNDLAL
jgi:transcriptional regulator with XRE-family HTH domain